METLLCASHPARRASLTCERCGNYACSECAIDAPWGVSVCAPCKSRGGLEYPLDWERGSMWNPLRFVRSARDVLLDAPTLFANLPGGGVGRALGFCAWVASLVALVSLLIELSQLNVVWSDGPTLRALSIYGASVFAEHVARIYVVVLVSAFGFHLIARAFGGEAPPAVAARTAGYGSAFLLYYVATGLVSSLTPFLELAALVIATLIQLYFYFTCLGIAAVEHYGVSRQRGAAVAGMTVALLAPTTFLVMALISAVGVYATRFSSWLPR
jgi:hypothetical protein